MDSLEEVSHTRDPKMEKTEQAKGWAIAPAGDTYGDSWKVWRPRPEGRRTLNPPLPPELTALRRTTSHPSAPEVSWD